MAQGIFGGRTWANAACGHGSSLCKVSKSHQTAQINMVKFYSRPSKGPWGNQQFVGRKRHSARSLVHAVAGVVA